MQNILFIVQTNTVSGAEIVLENYLKEMDENENLFLLTNNEVKNFYSEVFKETNIYSKKSMKRVYFSKNPFNYLQFISYILINIFAIHKIVKKHQIDVLYGNNSIDTVLITMYKMLADNRIKVVAHLHSIIEKNSMIGSFLDRFAHRLDHIIVPSNATKQSVKELIGNRTPVTTVYNGIDIPEKKKKTDYSSVASSLGLPEGKQIIAFVGAVEGRKRPDLFLSIIQNLSKLRDDFFAIIVGKTENEELKETLQKRIKEEELPVKIIGLVDYEVMMSLYEIIDYLILTSDRDPLPTVILESMAHGKIAISRDVDGAREMIQHQENGFLFPYEMSSEDAAKIVNDALGLSDEEKELIRKNARETINKTFNNQIKSEKINSILQSL
ncbi:glycosyltransferase [Rhodohalobacter sp. 614A]|uniref:glycosyltransferase n=1 Tax=Rhodohalobacter sp. 614A TaxID=2908649 RepID=UPI001F337BFA|nr:glycosyltransferase [Rhodohalobacter sp. 614A]